MDVIQATHPTTCVDEYIGWYQFESYRDTSQSRYAWELVDITIRTSFYGKLLFIMNLTLVIVITVIFIYKWNIVAKIQRMIDYDHMYEGTHAMERTKIELQPTRKVTKEG